MSLDKTLTGNIKVRVNPQYPVIAGVDEDAVPRLLKVDPDGGLAIGGGGALPKYDNFAIARYGSTNNVNTIIYKVGATEVARWTFTYVGGAVANDDDLATATLLIA